LPPPPGRGGGRFSRHTVLAARLVQAGVGQGTAGTSVACTCTRDLAPPVAELGSQRPPPHASIIESFVCFNPKKRSRSRSRSNFVSHFLGRPFSFFYRAIPSSAWHTAWPVLLFALTVPIVQTSSVQPQSALTLDFSQAIAARPPLTASLPPSITVRRRRWPLLSITPLHSTAATRRSSIPCASPNPSKLPLHVTKTPRADNPQAVSVSSIIVQPRRTKRDRTPYPREPPPNRPPTQIGVS
jgi:hypothetical protein